MEARGALEILDRKVFATGAVVFREGEAGTRAYVVQSGRVEVWREIDGERRVLGRIGAGGIFGEMALVDSKPRSASVSAVEPSVCIVVGERLFQRKIQKTDPFLAGLLRIFVKNIRSLHDKREAALLASHADGRPSAPAAAHGETQEDDDDDDDEAYEF